MRNPCKNETMKRIQIFILVAFLLNLLFIWGNSLLDGTQSKQVSDAVSGVVEKVIAAITEKPPQDLLPSEDLLSKIVRKVAHAVEFCCLGIWSALLFLPNNLTGNGCKTVCLIGLFVPLMDETIQLLTNRSSAVTDIWIDIAGYAVGSTVTALLLFWHAKKKHSIIHKG